MHARIQFQKNNLFCCGETVVISLTAHVKLASLGCWFGAGARDGPKKGDTEMSKRKNVSMSVSVAGWVGSFVGELIPALRECGIPDEEILAFVTTGGKTSVGKIAEVLAGAIRQAKNIFHLIASQHKITEEAVSAGNYDWTNENINRENFPYRNRPMGIREIVLLEFDHDPSSDQVMVEAEKQGLVRPDYEDALDFGEQFPEKQREFPIVFLHEPWQVSGGSGDVLVLLSFSSKRNLNLRCLDRRWHRSYRFAFVRRK